MTDSLTLSLYFRYRISSEQRLSCYTDFDFQPSPPPPRMLQWNKNMPALGKDLTGRVRQEQQSHNSSKKKQDGTSYGGPENEPIPVTSRDVVFGHVPLGNKNESTEYA